MSHRRSLLVSLSAGGGAAALALGLTIGAPSAFAVSIPTTQSSSPSGEGLEDVLTDPVEVVEDVTDRLASGGSDSSTPSGEAGGAGSSTGSGSESSGATSGEAPLAPVGSAVKDVLGQADEKTKDTPLAPVVPAPAPGGVLKLRVNAAPLATACAEVTGTGTAVANLDVTVGGHDIGTPLIEALPGLLAPCPSGSESGGGSGTEPGAGSGSEGADASVSELVGACVRIKAEPPQGASVLLLDHELVAELTEAGVPLEKLVVPCPQPGDGDGSGPGNDGGSGGDGGDGADGTGGSAGDGSDDGATGGGGSAGGSGSGGGDDACEPTINAQTTASSFLPTSGPQALPWVLLALALVGRRRLTQLVGLAGLARGAGATRATEL